VQQGSSGGFVISGLKEILLAMQEGDHTNNYVEVVNSVVDPAADEARERLMSEIGTLTAEERQKIEEIFGVSSI
jgi:hypothetical protein